MRYAIKEKRPEPNINDHSFHTITEYLTADDHNEATSRYQKLHPGYIITKSVPVSVK